VWVLVVTPPTTCEHFVHELPEASIATFDNHLQGSISWPGQLWKNMNRIHITTENDLMKHYFLSEIAIRADLNYVDQHPSHPESLCCRRSIATERFKKRRCEVNSKPWIQYIHLLRTSGPTRKTLCPCRTQSAAIDGHG
jgi:hypothetical protein